MRRSLDLTRAPPACDDACMDDGAALEGFVKDETTGLPIEGVGVTASSSNGERNAVTDALGTFRIKQIQPGLYTVKMSQLGFKPFCRTDVRVDEGRVVLVNAGLHPDLG